MTTSRRRFLATGAVTSVTLVNAATPTDDAGFRYCLNTATLMGFKLPITRQIDIAAQAGYNAIEPWLDSLHAVHLSRRIAPRLAQTHRRYRPDRGKRHCLPRVDRE